MVDSHWLAEIIWVQKTFGMIHSNTSKNFAVLSEYFMSTSNSSKLLFKISEIWVEWIVIFFVKWIHFWTLLQLLLFSCWQLYFWGYFKIYIWYLSFFLRKINYALPLTIFGSFAWSAPNGWGRFSCNFTEKFLHV